MQKRQNKTKYKPKSTYKKTKQNIKKREIEEITLNIRGLKKLFNSI